MKPNFLFSLVVLLTAFKAQSAQYEIRWGINLVPIKYFEGAAKEFKAKVEKRTNNKIKVTLIFNEFDDNRNHLNDVASGKYNMGQSPAMELANMVPEYKVWDLPFLFTDDEHVNRYLSSAHAKGNMDKIQKFGVTPVAHTYSGGFLAFYSDEKMMSFSQLKNQHIALEGAGTFLKQNLSTQFNITNNPLEHGDIIEKATSKSPVAYAEIISASMNMVFDELQKTPKYVNKTDHRVITRVLVLNTSFLKSLPKKYRKIVLEEAAKAAKLERDLSITDKNASYKMLAEKPESTLNVWSLEQKESGRALFQSMYDSFTQNHDHKAVQVIDSLRTTSKKIANTSL